MTGSAIDASVLLAVIRGEPGWQLLISRITHSLVSTVNIAEVVARLVDLGMPEAEVLTLIAQSQLTVVPYDLEQALVSGSLRPLTRRAGLSLGDRACLALARVKGLPVLTADRAWADLAGDIGVTVELIR